MDRRISSHELGSNQLMEGGLLYVLNASVTSAHSFGLALRLLLFGWQILLLGCGGCGSLGLSFGPFLRRPRFLLLFLRRSLSTGFIFVRTVSVQNGKCSPFSRAHSHALTNAMRRHEYFWGLSRLLPVPGVLVSFLELRFLRKMALLALEGCP